MPHTFPNLKATVSSSPACTECAEKMPLMHTVRHKDGLLKLLNIFRTGRLGGADICQRGSTDSAQNNLDIPENSAYFYAGRVFPDDFDPPACFFLENSESSMKGGASPFDTGGLDKGVLKLWVSYESVAHPSKLDYSKDHRVSPGDWREYFSLFLQEFFQQPDTYWNAAPIKEIDGVSFSQSDDWRNWCFEIYSSEPVTLDQTQAIFLPENVINHLNQLLEYMPKMAPLMSKLRQCLSIQIDALEEAKRLAL